MSGHSKWSKVKHQKGVADIKKGQIFTKIANSITIAVREGGGIADPNANFKLRLAIEKAKSVNMPKANIDRAIERGLGKSTEANLEEVIYEGFGPGNSAVIIKAVTDNRQRTNASLKNIFNSYGGRLTSPGAVSYLFDEAGFLKIKRDPSKNEDWYMEVALQSGSTDVELLPEVAIFYTRSADLHKVKEKIASLGGEVLEAEIIYKPKSKINIENGEEKNKIKNFLEELENNDDIQKVFFNCLINSN